MRRIHVVSQRSWMVNEAHSALDDAWTVRGHHGLSALPETVATAPDDLVWAPGAYLARSIIHGSTMRLAAPKPWALTKLNDEATRRPIHFFSAAEAVNRPHEGFWKLADVKDDRYPAAWRTADEIKHLAAELPAATGLLFCPEKLSFTCEFRAWILNGRIVEFTQYVDDNGHAYDHPGYRISSSETTATAYRFARTVAWNIPDACVLDVGFANTWMAIELNPVWSSNWYNADLRKITDVLSAAQGPYVYAGDLWVPDQLLVSQALRLGPLPIDGLRASHSANSR